MSRPILTTLLLFACALPVARADDLHEQAVRESLTPIRPGPPFWNEHARQFIFAPAFDFKAVRGASVYRFVLTCADGRSRSFEAQEPWAPLTPAWSDIPVGAIRLRTEGLNKPGGEVVGIAGERQFHRAAVFNGPYGKPVVPYAESARIALDGLIHEPFVQSWRTTGRPDPAYPLYRYASKLLGSLMSGCALYANQSPRPADADEAIEIARRAGDFLLSISAPPGTPLEYFPPTYHDAKPTERENDHWTMLISPAEAGQGYLDLYDVTHDAKYLDAARRIARTYSKTQLASGTWPLKVDNRTGEPTTPIALIPSMVISFHDRLATQYNFAECQPTLDRAVKWTMDNPVKTFDWKAQFDDAKLRGPYENLSKHEACLFAGYLFAHKKPDEIALGEELLRFAEDQFVIWEQPPALAPRDDKLGAQNWFTPCSAEQYAMFEPISGSSAFMIIAYLRAYEATGKPLYLAKAKSLANALTLAQQHHHGRYPTRMIRDDLAYWINSSVNTIRAIHLLAQAGVQ